MHKSPGQAVINLWMWALLSATKVQLLLTLLRRYRRRMTLLAGHLPAAAPLGKDTERGSLSGDESDSDGDDMELDSRDDTSDAYTDFDLPDAARDDDAQ